MTASDALFILSCVVLVAAFAALLVEIELRGRRRRHHAHPRRFWE